MPIKAIVGGVEKEITRIPVLVNDVYKDAWEVRDNQDQLVWYRNDTLTGISSISFKGYGLLLKSETVKGQTSQNGTPAPDSPVDVVGCGEKTENLFDSQNGDFKKIYIRSTDGYVGSSGFATTAVIQCAPNTVYTSTNPKGNRHTLACFSSYPSTGDTATSFVSDATSAVLSITTDANAKYLALFCNDSTGGSGEPINDVKDAIMLNTGSTALPYEPYGYSIPLVANSVNYPIYLGEVQSTRRIKKIVFDGTQQIFNCVATNGDPTVFCCVFKYLDIGMSDIINYNVLMYTITYPTFMSDRFKMKSPTRLYNTILDGEVGANSFDGMNRYIIFCVSGLTTAEEYAQWFSEHPTTIYYILATPETAIVNEPLMKIGDYADEVTVNTAIPTSVGTNTFSVNTTLAPSGCSITGHIKATL